MQRLQSLVSVSRVEGAVENEALRVALLHRGIAVGRIEAVLVEIGEIGRLQDRHVIIAVHEQVVVHGLGVVFLELVFRPLLRRRAQI
jgi:chorismate-pyruvate lyase